MRRVYDPWDHEVQLRLVAPEGGSNRYDMPGVGQGVLTVRAKVLLEYHNSKLGGHLGVDKTVNRIWKDWYWPGLYDDVDRWCRSCDLCRGEKAHNAVSAWSRTELYSRPFRVLQIDTVACKPGSNTKPKGKVADRDHGMKHILTCICCFSRWVWLIPIPDTSAETIAKALLERVLLDIAMFPTVIRSDRAREFTDSVIAYINAQLEIRHVLGSAYHPQSQGMVERMHRTMKLVGKALTEDHPHGWPDMIPYAQCILRILPLKALGNRSPYEVVTGLRPKLPTAMVARFPVQEITVDLYAEQLIAYLRTMYARLKALMADAQDAAETEAPGNLDHELQVGDLVLRIRSPHQLATAAGPAPLRFTRHVDPVIYRVTHRSGGQPFAYRIVDNGDPTRRLKFEQPVNREYLVKMDMPELQDPGVQERRRIEVYNVTPDVWRKGTLEKVAQDGRAKVRWDDDPEQLATLELADYRFRWLVGEVARDWDAA